MDLTGCVTPRTEQVSVIPSMKVTSKDIAEVGQIDNEPIVRKSAAVKALFYTAVIEHSKEDRESDADQLTMEDLLVTRQISQTRMVCADDASQ